MVVTAAEDSVVFQKPLEGGREIVVIRGPARDTSIVDGFGDAVLKDARSVYEVRMEVRSAGQMPFLLWSETKYEPTNPKEAGFDVLDLSVAPGGCPHVAVARRTVSFVSSQEPRHQRRANGAEADALASF